MEQHSQDEKMNTLHRTTFFNISTMLTARFVSCVVGLAVIFGTLIFLGRIKTMELMEINILKREIVEQKALVDQKYVIQGLLVNISRELEKAQSMLLPPEESLQELQIKFQNSMENFAREQQVTIQRLKWLPPEPGPIVRISISMLCKGTMENIARFIKRVENGHLFYTIDLLKIVPIRNSPLVTAELVVSAYQFKSEQ